MAELLEEVRGSEDRDLIGITERGREVFLIRQGSDVRKIKLDLLNPEEKEYSKWLRQQMSVIVKDYGEDVFVELKEAEPIVESRDNGIVVFFYNLYRLRNGG